jgi:hypothetical protein
VATPVRLDTSRSDLTADSLRMTDIAEEQQSHGYDSSVLLLVVACRTTGHGVVLLRLCVIDDLALSLFTQPTFNSQERTMSPRSTTDGAHTCTNG